MSEHELWNELGNQYFLAGAYPQAVHAYNRSIESNERFGRPYSNLALRRFSRDRFLVRVFGVANPVDDSGFIRSLAAWSVRDNVALEASGGLFAGSTSGTDTLSRFRERDFVFTRIRWFF